MSWLSNFIKKLIGEDEPKHHVKEMKQTSSNHEKRKNSKGDTSKSEIQAKVIYQYPKGNFRFPVIPDEQSKPKSKRPRKNDSIHKKKFNNHFRHKENDKKSDFKPNSGGFRPTEIPSPIFGFGPRNDLENSYKEIANYVDESTEHQYESHLIPPLNTEMIQEYNEKSFNTYQNAGIELDEQIVEFEKVEIDNKHDLEIFKEDAASYEQNVKKAFDFDHTTRVEQEKEDEDKEINEFINDVLSSDLTEQEEKKVPNEPLMEREEIDNLSDIHDQKQEEVITHEEHKSYDEEEIEISDVNHVNTDKAEEPKTALRDSLEGRKEENTSQIHIKEKRTTTVPYNVLMFGRDKRILKQKEEGYKYPSLSLLNEPPIEQLDDKEWIHEQKELLDLTLKNFNVRARVVNVTQGPSVTRLEVQPEPGVKVSKITNLTDDIKLSLSARDIRIEAPIPGKNTIGIEVPNKKSKMVFIKEIINSTPFLHNTSPLTVALGLDISGQPIVTDIKKMPHGLIAGATGSGKSVCINTILVSLLYKAFPQDVKLLLIDPKMVELAPYNNIPHLVAPVITDVKAATASLKWAVEEMERRYELFAHTGVRDITKYNENVKRYNQGEKLPYIVIVIDELADLMMVAPGDVEEAICRIAQKARACGIHLLIATQRPSVDVITGLIKANIPTRIAFSVSSQVDSRTIIDTSGAERLLGKGDMLFLENGSSKPVRVQGNFVSDEEIERVVGHVRKQGKPKYLFKQEELLKKANVQSEDDELFYEACEFVIEQGGASTSSLQRRFRIGYNRAARLMDLMEEHGIISEPKGSKPRDVLVTEEDIEALKENGSNI